MKQIVCLSSNTYTLISQMEQKDQKLVYTAVLEGMAYNVEHIIKVVAEPISLRNKQWVEIEFEPK